MKTREEILFERKSLSGNTEPGGEARKGAASDVGNGAYADCYPRIARCLTAEYDSSPCIDRGQNICVYESKSALEENWSESEVKNALRANASKSDHCVVENASAFMGGQGAKARSIAYCDDGTSPTLKSSPSGGNTVPDVCYCLQGNGIDRADTAGCNGAGWKEDVGYTLNTIDRPAVAFAMQAFGDYKKSDVGSGLKARDYKDATDLVCSVDCRNMNESPELYPTLQAKPNGGQSLNFSHAIRVNYIVRRLTPLECSRLQGFPDCWELGLETPILTEEDIAFWAEVFETHRKVVSPDVKPKTRNQIIKWLKDPYSDSASYKMWGNGMALPNMLFVVSRIKEIHQNA